KGDRVALHAERSDHCPEGKIQIEKDGALLDVELEVSGGVREFLPAFLYALEIDSVFGKCRRQGDAVLVAKTARFVHVEVAGAGGRPEEAFAETGAFFVGPIHQADGYRRFAAVMGGDAAQNFHAG